MSINPGILLLPLAFVLLHYGKFILLPLSLSLFIFVIIKSISNKLTYIIHNFLYLKINKIFSFLIVFFLVFLIFYSMWELSKFNILLVIEKTDFYQKNLEIISNKILILSLHSFFEPFKESINQINFAGIFRDILSSFTNFAGIFSLVLIYMIFFIVEEKFFINKFKLLTNDKKSIKIIDKIKFEIFNYFLLKSFTSILTGVFTFIVLKLINCDLAILFGIFSFFLNFIPFLGSILSVIIPVIFSGIQFLNLFEPLIIFISLFFVQLLIGNFIEPKLIGRSLNLSPMVMILVLSIMGKLWGIAGMFLSVPFLVVLLIIFNNFKSTKKLAILISERGIT